MLKELKYLLYMFVIFIFLFLTLKFYFSDDNKKNSYRSLLQVDEKTFIYSQKLILLMNDTKYIVEYVKKAKDKKDYNFWKLITNND
tara:strand:- start:935 stop:1192 length:258 start_codon:yes stop_codon:yes gene_type:complete